MLKAGHRQFRWHDATRDRPVWVDVWYPSTGPDEERTILYGLGEGRVVPSGAFAAGAVPCPLAVLSHGAGGSAGSYGWLSEYLARNGVVVLGVSHYGESQAYGTQTIDPGAITRLWTRPPDCSFALTRLLSDTDIGPHIARDRITAVGHSSGGATAVALGGAAFDPEALGSYCRSDAANGDRGCAYARDVNAASVVPPEAVQSYRDTRITALVIMDPAAGPGFSEAALAAVNVPVLLIASTANDFLPFEHHAQRYARLLPHPVLVALQNGEGHFVFLNVCRSEWSANGVPLCADRPGVDRAEVHASLASMIHAFVSAQLTGV